MRIAVIRDDLPGPLVLSDLEPVSQYTPTYEPRGQEGYLSRVTEADIEAVLADSSVGAGAATQGSDISGSFPLTITGSSNDVLRLKTSSGASFTDVTLTAGAQADLDALLANINAALVTAGLDIVAQQGPGSGDRVQLESTVRGVDSYLELDTVGNGSTANTDLGLTDGARDMPSAADYITDTAPSGGPLDVSVATIEAVGTSTNASALAIIPDDRGTAAAIADAVAPQFADTDVAVDSFLVGVLAGYRSANFNPDPRRGAVYSSLAIADGAAIDVVEDDGSTSAASTYTLPTITSATLDSPSPGDVTIAGTGLTTTPNGEGAGRHSFSTGGTKHTRVKFTGDVQVVLPQEVIEANGGSVTYTSIVVPASLISGAAVTTTSVQVQARQRASDVEALV